MSDFVIEDLDSCNIRVRCERHLAKSCLITSRSRFPVTSSCPPIVQEVGWTDQTLQHVFAEDLCWSEAYIEKFCADRGYRLDKPSRKRKTWTADHLESLLRGLNIQIDGKAIRPHQHQLEAILHGMNTSVVCCFRPLALANL